MLLAYSIHSIHIQKLISLVCVNGVVGDNNSEVHHDVVGVATFFMGSIKTFLMVIRLNKWKLVLRLIIMV